MDPSLSCDALLKCIEYVPLVIIGAGSDLASSCVRMKIAMGCKVVEANAACATHGRAVFLPGDCITHIMHRESESNGVDSIIKTMYSFAWALSLLDVQTRSAKVLEAIVRRDLATGFFPGVRPPDDGAKAHITSIADLTVLRLKLVRASVEDGDHVEPTVLELHAEYCQLCNGDTRKHHCVHFCWVKGCCDGQRLEVCIHRFIRLFMETVFMALGIDLPSPLRWYTYSPHLARQTLGQTTYGILPRVLNGLVDSEALQPTGNNVDADSFHASVTQKKLSALEFHSGPDCARQLLTALIATVPCDHFSLRLQHLDFVGSSLSELVDRRPGNLLAKCQRKLWDITHWAACATERCGDVPALLWVIAGGIGSSAEDAVDALTAMTAGQGAAVFIRVEMKFHEGPVYRWLHGHLGDAASTDHEFKNSNRCRWFKLLIINRPFCIHDNRAD